VVPVTARRIGVSLIELLVALGLAGLVGGIIAITLGRQQQFYRNSAETGFVRESVRDAMDVLSTDIRQLSVADTVRLMGDSAIEFFSTIGTSIVCTRTGDEIGLPVNRLSGNSLSSFLAQPDTGDIAAFYIGSLGRWERYRIAGVFSRSLSNSCPVGTGFSTPSDPQTGSTGLVLSLGGLLSESVRPGAPVRLLRRGRYSLYHASDGAWYLGYRRCNAIGPSVCGSVQPVSGPYRSYSSDRRLTGVVFEYFDSIGQRVTASNSFALARVDITARADAGAAIASPAGRISDSATTTVSIRNRIR